SWCVCNLKRGLSLSKSIANFAVPTALDGIDKLGVYRLTSTYNLLRRRLHERQVGLNEHAPSRRRGTEAGNAFSIHLRHQSRSIKARVVVDENGGACDPRRKEI